jgi:hypothetical protein
MRIRAEALGGIRPLKLPDKYLREPEFPVPEMTNGSAARWARPDSNHGPWPNAR